VGSGGVASRRIQIVLADDHAMIRGGLRRVLDTEMDLHVVAEAADAEAALRATRVHQPQVVVLDLKMPGLPRSRQSPGSSRLRPTARSWC
jgi:DNA-binding NarL/FixJ family response regulator